MLPKIVAGDTLTHTVTLTDYPASQGWVLSYRLVPRGAGTAYTFDAAASGDDHLVTVAAATTATWVAGEYTVAAWVTGTGSERFSIASETGQATLYANPATIATGTDTRTQAEVALADARAAFAAWSPATKSYTIAGRQMQFNTPAEIIAVVNHWAGEVKREKRAADLAAGLGNTSGKVYVRMARA